MEFAKKELARNVYAYSLNGFHDTSLPACLPACLVKYFACLLVCLFEQNTSPSKQASS